MQEAKAIHLTLDVRVVVETHCLASSRGKCEVHDRHWMGCAEAGYQGELKQQVRYHRYSFSTKHLLLPETTFYNGVGRALVLQERTLRSGGASPFYAAATRVAPAPRAPSDSGAGKASLKRMVGSEELAACGSLH